MRLWGWDDSAVRGDRRLERSLGVPGPAVCARLKEEFGMPQESHWRWWRSDQGPELVTAEWARGLSEPTCSAPTVAEMGRILPVRIRGEDGRWQYLLLRKTRSGFSARYGGGSSLSPSTERLEGEEEAECRASLLVWLAERRLAPWQGG